MTAQAPISSQRTTVSSSNTTLAFFFFFFVRSRPKPKPSTVQMAGTDPNSIQSSIQKSVWHESHPCWTMVQQFHPPTV